MSRIFLIVAGFCSLSLLVATGDEHPAFTSLDLKVASSPAHSRDENWKPGDDIALEISGMLYLGGEKQRLAVCTRKGDVLFIDGVLGKPEDLQFTTFASGLHEPLGLAKEGDDLLVTQRAEVTRLRDRNGDDIADSYLTEASGWNVSGNYHAYAYGPERDGSGNLWVTLNLGMGDFADNSIGWRGWGGTLDKQGNFLPQSFGMRSPCGLGSNTAGDVFFTDQQGTWIPATPIHHLRPGVFYGNQESKGTLTLTGAPMQLEQLPKPNQPYPQAVDSVKEFVPPAVWLPYNKMGRSATDIEVVPDSVKSDAWAPFAGQLLVGEFTNCAINRVFLEKVGGEYQGACFPFLSGFPAAVVRMRFAENDSLLVGMTNRGWTSLGNRSYGLVRVDPKAKPFSIREMRATPTGFTLLFSKPVSGVATEKAVLKMERFTYQYSSRYGGDEIDTQKVPLSDFSWSDDRTELSFVAANRGEHYVHALQISGITDNEGSELDHPVAYYTLSRIPR